ncbi:unnamed protein product [Leptosia nina]|uniref:NADP-dependent oxidoreductase domain-containing protein n=1 Tax=Leptosia nina TaxID=320188 RepID=A0AAV1JL31_9NEOP
MEDVGHSRLLKFFVSGTTMSDNDPIESKVPGEQPLRGDPNTVEQLPEDHYEPVITVTKQETSVTKGDIKAEKMTITEDVSDGLKTKEIAHEILHVREESGIDQVTQTKMVDTLSVQDGSHDIDKGQNDDKKVKSKIPMLKLRKAMREIAEDRRKMEIGDKEVPIQKRKSSIPRLKEKPSNLEITKTTQNAPSHQEQRKKSKFKEIIHDYDENKVKPLDVEKIRSRIPMLKRKSEHDIELTKLSNRRLSHKKRSSIDNPHKTNADIKALREKLINGKSLKAPMRVSGSKKEQETPASDVKSLEQQTSSSESSSDESNKVSLAISEIDTVISNADKDDNNDDNVENVNDTNNNYTINSLEIKPTLTKSASVTIPQDEIDQTNHTSIRRAVSHENQENNDKLTSNLLVQKVLQEQEKSHNSSDCDSVSPSKGEAEALEEPVSEEKLNRPIKHDVCQETSTLIRNIKNTFEPLSNTAFDSELKEKTDSAEAILTEPTIAEPEVLEIQTNDLIENNTDDPKKMLITSETINTNEKENNKTKEVKESSDSSSSSNNSEDESKSPNKTVEDVVEEITKNDDIPQSYVHQNDNNNDDRDIKPAINFDSHPTATPPIKSNDNIEPDFTSNETNKKQPILGHPKALFNQPITNFTPITLKNNEQDNLITNGDTPKAYTPKGNDKTEPSNVDTRRILNKNIDQSIEDLKEKRLRDKSRINELLSDVNEDDIIILKGKVNRVISRLDSRDYSGQKKKEMIDEVPKKSVLSKIALFEEKEAKVKDTPRQTLRTNSQTARDLPKIVDEVLKPQTKIDAIVDTNKELPKTKVTWVNTDNKKADTDNRKKLSSYKSRDNVFLDKYEVRKDPRKIEITRELSYAENDLGDAVRGRVREMVVRMVSLERMDLEKKGLIEIKEKPRGGSVSEKIALFETKVTTVKTRTDIKKNQSKEMTQDNMTEEELKERIQELKEARKYGKFTDLKYIELNDGCMMPALGVGTALLNKNLTKHIISAAIDLGYRTIDTAYIYGNEKEIGEAINEKINDGTVKREELFIISKLWSTFHRRDLVEKACKMSLKAMGLDYFDLYLIHNPMSFKEGDDPVPKIANVIQYSESDYLDAWIGVEHVVKKGWARRAGVSNFNSAQLDRIIDKGRIKPVVNQVECHPYLTQYRLDEFCQSRDVKLSCYGVLGSKGTPLELKSGISPVIDDPMVLAMAAGLNITPAQLLISYQLHLDHSVVVKASSGSRLWSNLQAQNVKLDSTQMSGLNALNRNKRNFTFKGLGDTHRNYPFRIPF